MEGAKDPDEYIIKYGNSRFNNLVEKALSVIEFKVKVLKQNLNLESVNDKIKFLNEIAKLIARVDNTIEREIYIERIAKEYDISKEAIYAEVNKQMYRSKSEKTLEKPRLEINEQKIEENPISEKVRKRENTAISILLTGDMNVFQIMQQNIKVEDFKDTINQEIAKKLYEEFEKGNSNINSMIDMLGEREQNHITEIMADDYEIQDMEKAIDDVMQGYERDKLSHRKFEILALLGQNLESNQKEQLEKELRDIGIRLNKISKGNL